MQNIAQDLTEYVSHNYRCVQYCKPLREQSIGGDTECTCGLNELVNQAYAEVEP